MNPPANPPNFDSLQDILNPERQVLADLARDVNLSEGPLGVERVWAAITKLSPLSIKDLSREVGLPIPVVSALRREAEKLDLLKRDKGVKLTEKGRELALALWGTDRLPEFYLEPPLQVPSLPHKIQEKLEGLMDNRPEVDFTLDQSFGTLKTAVFRVCMGIQHGVVLGRHVLFLGDDDLLSLTMGILIKEWFGESALEKMHLTVIDTDERFCKYLREVAEKEGLPLSVVEADLRNPIELPALAHTFYTDPPYTPAGLELFCSRALDNLSFEWGATGIVSFNLGQETRRLEIQEVLSEMGLYIIGLWPGVNKYHGGAVLGNQSDLILLHADPNSPRPPIGKHSDPLYTRDFRNQPPKYKCLQCGEELLLGKENIPTTITTLKRRGCPICSGTKFKKY